MAEMKSLNGYEIVDAKAREDIETLKSTAPELTGYATEEWVHGQNFATASLAERTLEQVLADDMGTRDGEGLELLSGAIYHGGIYDSYALRCEWESAGVTIKVPRIEVKTQDEYDALTTKDSSIIYIIKEE